MADEKKLPLLGRRAVVTGAGRGIGRSIALALADAGADVGVTARSETELEKVVEEIQARGRRGLVATCDVTDVAQVQHMATTLLSGLGGIDILVNNAGNAGSHKILNHPDELWHRMLAINLTSVYYVCKAFVPTLVEQRQGRIITVASIASRVGDRYIYVDTPMTDASVQNIMARTGMAETQAREALVKMSPQHRLIEPEEVAAMAVYLSLDISKGITGQAINIDGGGIMS